MGAPLPHFSWCIRSTGRWGERRLVAACTVMAKRQKRVWVVFGGVRLRRRRVVPAPSPLIAFTKPITALRTPNGGG